MKRPQVSRVLTTRDASAAILAAMPAAVTETVRLERATGRVLQQTVVAERDQPPFDRVTMDGIAIKYSALDSNHLNSEAV